MLVLSFPSSSNDSWQELHFLALRAGVSVEHLCQTVEAATQFAKASVGNYVSDSSPFYPQEDDLEAVVRGLWDDAFLWETKSVLWNESEHPRDEFGRFAGSGLHAAMRGERYYGPTSGDLENNPDFWGGGSAARDPVTSAHFNGRFEVHVPLAEQASLNHLAQRMFGRPLEPHEWGELIGAPDGEKLEARALPLAVLIQHPDGTQSPLFTTLMRQARLGDAHGVDATIVAHLVNTVIVKHPDAPTALSPRMIAYSARKCQQLGIRHIVSLAEGDRNTRRTIGYKHWPKLGFDAQITGAERTNLGRIAPRFKTANTLLELYAMPGGEEAWSKVGGSKKMYFDTTAGSPSQQTLAAYLKSKGASL